jgi:hypothetical protein
MVVAWNKLLWGTGPIDRLLLIVTVALLPMQANIPTFKGMGVLFFVFAGLIVYQLFVRPRILFRTAQHPVFLTGFIFLGIAFIFETVQGHSSYSGILRIGFMMIGGVLLASLCRDRRALESGMYGYILGGVILSALLVFTTQGRLNPSEAGGDFYEASVQRGKVFQGNPLKDNLNTMSFFAAQSAIVAIALALGETRFFQRYVLFGLSAICIMGTLIPMSRSGLVILVMSSGLALFSYGVMRPRVILAVGVLAAIALAWMPAMMWDRLTISTEKTQMSNYLQDSRVDVFQTVMKYFPEYAITGVGEGNYYGEWGSQRDFRQGNGQVMNPHNSYARVLINWGAIGLIAFLMFVWQVYRCLPTSKPRDPLKICLRALALAVFLWLFLIDTIQAKEFSMILGFLVAADLWVWPRKRGINTGARRVRHDTGVSSSPSK